MNKPICKFGLTSTRSACLVYLGGTRSHNGGRVSTFACRLLLYPDSPRATSGKPRVNAYTNSLAQQLAVSGMRSLRRVLHFSAFHYSLWSKCFHSIVQTGVRCGPGTCSSLNKHFKRSKEPGYEYTI